MKNNLLIHRRYLFTCKIESFNFLLTGMYTFIYLFTIKYIICKLNNILYVGTILFYVCGLLSSYKIINFL